MSRHIVIIGFALRERTIKNHITVIGRIKADWRKVTFIQLRNLLHRRWDCVDKAIPEALVHQVEHPHTITRLETNLTLQSSIENAGDGARGKKSLIKFCTIRQIDSFR